MVIRTIFIFSALLISTALTSACVPLAISAGAATGIAATKEGGLSSEISDANIQATINDSWFQYDIDMFRKLNMTVEQGNVLITGVVQEPEHRVEAVRLAWNVEGVKQVINEVQVADSDGVTGYLRDTWIGTQLRARLTASRSVSAINYSIDVVKGTIYLMGIARSQAELNEAIDIARNIQYVQNVVSYVRVETPQTPVIQGAKTSNNVTNNQIQQSSLPPKPDANITYGNDVAPNIPVTNTNPVIGIQQPIVEDTTF